MADEPHCHFVLRDELATTPRTHGFDTVFFEGWFARGFRRRADFTVVGAVSHSSDQRSLVFVDAVFGEMHTGVTHEPACSLTQLQSVRSPLLTRMLPPCYLITGAAARMKLDGHVAPYARWFSHFRVHAPSCSKPHNEPTQPDTGFRICRRVRVPPQSP